MFTYQRSPVGNPDSENVTEYVYCENDTDSVKAAPFTGNEPALAWYILSFVAML